MKTKLGTFTNTWDAAALETLGSEFYMTDLMTAQKVTSATGESILDYLVFDGGLEIEVPDAVIQETEYFKAPWDEEDE